MDALYYAKCVCCAIAIGLQAGNHFCQNLNQPIVIGAYSANACGGAYHHQNSTTIGPYSSCYGNRLGVAVGSHMQRYSGTTSNVIAGYTAHQCGGSSQGSDTSRCNIVIGTQANVGGRYTCGNVAIGAWALYCTGFCCYYGYSNRTAIYNVAVGSNAGSQTTGNINTCCYQRGNVYAGSQSRVNCTTGDWNTMAIGACSYSARCYASFGVGSTTGVYVCGTVTKGSGTFQIVHPNPKKINKWLHHSFTESPNAGDNLYRYKFNISNCEYCFKLPNYYKYLNTCNMAWVYPTDHFGQGHAKIDDKKENLIIKTDTDGCYTVLLMGTRCDAWALKHWQGTERHRRPDKWSCNLKKV